MKISFKRTYKKEEILTPLRKQRKHILPYTQLDVYGNIVYRTKMAWKKLEGSFWTPVKVNEELVGKILAVIDGDYGKQYVIQTSDGKNVTTPSHRVLQGLMISAKENDKVKLVYTGEQETTKKGHSATKMYDVFIDE